jgi:hypothetical protein
MTKKKLVEKNELVASKQDLVEEVKRRRENGTVFKVIKNDDGEIASSDVIPEFDIQLLRTFGTVDIKCGIALLDQLASAYPGNLEDQDRAIEIMNNITPLMHGIAPKNELEAMLAVQTVAVHNLAMFMARQAAKAGTIEGINSHVNSLTKLTRTFTAQMEALGKYRNRGQQKVVVEHVHVNSGGQAVIGPVETGGGDGK